jgi:hypothetical protein
MIYNNKRKNKNTTVGTIPNLNIKIAERGNIDKTPATIPSDLGVLLVIKLKSEECQT